MFSYRLDHLRELESESIFVLREVAAQFERPALLFSGGKDSIVVSYLAMKAFYPARVPFPLLHIDTGHNFQETIQFRDYWAEKLKINLLVRSVQDSIDKGRVQEEKGINASRNALQTVTLLDAIAELKLDAGYWWGKKRWRESAGERTLFFLTGMISDNGIPKINGLNCGIYSMGEKIQESISGSFLWVTGLSWMFGAIFNWKK